MAEWRSVWVACGVQYVMMAGTAMMLPQCADNWDTVKPIKIAHDIITMIKQSYVQRGQSQLPQHALAREVDQFTYQGLNVKEMK